MVGWYGIALGKWSVGLNLCQRDWLYGWRGMGSRSMLALDSYLTHIYLIAAVKDMVKPDADLWLG